MKGKPYYPIHIKKQSMQMVAAVISSKCNGGRKGSTSCG